MARVLIKCPVEGRVVSTGQRMTEQQLSASTAEYAFRCIACNGVHHWRGDVAWVEHGDRQP
ncbi:MAG TPA: hypothetical protein VFW47_08715 [Phenylobacterium sp.]|nr:hypothetical protein [Phenylobacterium sp.]